VIYVGTYSKPFATGVRMGFGFLPEPLLSVVSRIKGNHDFGTANLLQQLLGRALASGAYSRHLKVLRTRYAHKAQVMTKALEKHFPDGIEWLPPRGGMYVWAKLPGAVKSGLQSRLFKAALAQDVLYVPGELCYADDLTRSKPDTEMRISFGGATVADMRQGIARLGGVLRKALWRT
jgi:2-aminoadipate transaminase